MARRSNGSVVAWGDNTDGQSNVPALPPGLTYVQIAKGEYFSAARRSDGSVVAWGDNTYGQCNVPALPAGLSYVQVAAGGVHAIARRSDDHVLAWGLNGTGQCNVPEFPAGWTCVEVSAGWYHSLARLVLSFGSFCFGDGSEGACPCNNSGAAGRGCENSTSTGGALLAGSGVASLASDTLQFNCSGETPGALSLVFQGDATHAPTPMGDGLRCVGGHLKRLYMKTAVSGVITAPSFPDPTVSARSAALGDPIPPNAIRMYHVYYRDSSTSFCAAPLGTLFNVSSAMSILWVP